VDVRLGWRLTSLQAEADGVALTLASGARTVTERARLVVGADGAHSAVRALAFPDRPWPRRYLALQE